MNAALMLIAGIQCSGLGEWFACSRDQWTALTGLSRSEQERARALLRERGLLEEKREGIPARLLHRIRVDAPPSSLQEISQQQSVGHGSLQVAPTDNPLRYRLDTP